MNCNKNRPRRERVLIVAHDDNFIEVYGGKNVDVWIERFSSVQGDDGERLAENFLEVSLPPRWRELYYPGFLRASLANHPLLPSTMDEAQWIRDFLTGINSMLSQTPQVQEVMAWTL